MDDIVWIREEPPAPDIGNHSATSDNIIPVEHYSGTLLTQVETSSSPQFPLTNVVNSTDLPVQNQLPESAGEKPKCNEEKRVSFNIPPPNANCTESTTSDPSVQKQQGVESLGNSSPDSKQGRFNIAISYPSASESASTDNLSEKQPERLDQNPPKELEKGAPVSVTSYPGSALPVLDSSIQKQSDDKSQDLKQSNERGSFNISISYPTTSEDNSTDNLSGKQPELPDRSNELKEPQQQASVSEMPCPNSTSPLADSSIQKQSSEGNQDASKENNERRGFSIMITYPGDSENKQMNSSSEKQPDQFNQNPPKELEKGAVLNETSSPATVMPVVDSSFQKQSNDGNQALKEDHERRGFNIIVSYPGDSENKQTDSSSGKKPEQPDQNPLKEFEKGATVDEMPYSDSALPVVDSSTEQKSDNRTQEAFKRGSDQRSFDIAASYPGDSENRLSDNSSEKQPWQPSQNASKEFEKGPSLNETPCTESTWPGKDSSIQKHTDEKAQETAKQGNEEDFNTTLSLPDNVLTKDAVPISVEVFDPTNTTLTDSTSKSALSSHTDSTQAAVNDFGPPTTSVPVTAAFTAQQMNDEAAKGREDPQAVKTKPLEELAQITNHNDIDRSEDTFDISEYERNLNRTTEETKDLVNKLCDTSQKLNQNTISIASDVAAQRKCLYEDVYKTIEDIEQLPPPPELPTGGWAGNVESLIVGDGVLKYVTGCVVLPNGTVLATDEDAGLLLFDIQGNLLKTVANTNWRKPRSPVCHKEHILMLVDIEETQGDWCRYIVKFTINLDFVAKIEGPKWMRNETIVSDRLSIAHTDYIYLSVAGQFFSALYESDACRSMDRTAVSHFGVLLRHACIRSCWSDHANPCR
ncbi:hypothetical protein KIN20_010494 [Parelaphostrongylus tenuis]|uniref:Uncharacterized protein n=1 Tax=Parelaphostrongylus tenuis TaxID=148309 RepID=A0AAD5QLV8_PARTN|nr:hypothetical protein KIN20_010494 [Parelaphostrongylus tenuis]